MRVGKENERPKAEGLTLRNARRDCVALYVGVGVGVIEVLGGWKSGGAGLFPDTRKAHGWQCHV